MPVEVGPVVVEPAGMRAALREVLAAGDGVASRSQVESGGRLDRNGVEYAVRNGQVVRPLPRTFMLPAAG